MAWTLVEAFLYAPQNVNSYGCILCKLNLNRSQKRGGGLFSFMQPYLHLQYLTYKSGSQSTSECAICVGNSNYNL